MRRHGFGLFAIVFLVIGLALFLWGGGGDDSEWVTGICVRVGLLLGALWLALPQLAQLAERAPPWLSGGALLVAVIAAIRPKAIPYLLPLLAAMLVLQFWGWLAKPLAAPAKKPKRTKSS